MKCIVFRVGQAPVIEEVAADLRAQQALVGGNIEGAALSADLTLIFDAMGKLRKPPSKPNRVWVLPTAAGLPGLLPFVVAAGDCFVTRGNDEGDGVDVTPEDVLWTLLHLWSAEMYS